ncbi:WASH complex subunit FAM21 [Cricetulus griseus]|nr:WASH complex subunit FAM21 [Cricetulus griseus]
MEMVPIDLGVYMFGHASRTLLAQGLFMGEPVPVDQAIQSLPTSRCQSRLHPLEEESYQSIGPACTHQDMERPHQHQLEEGMGRRQYKNTFNNRKTNMMPPESRDSTPTRPEHPNTDEAEENYLKNNFMEMIEILKDVESGLEYDLRLLQFLQEFSQQTISRTHEIKKQVDGLIQETKATHCRLHNVFNDFLMLSNTQFIENRVYDEEVEEQVLKAEAEKSEQEKTREQKEVDLIPKVREAVNYGLQVLDSAFEQLDIKAGNSDSEEEDANERVELILEPKDLYIDRPLPYLIGSKLFMEQEDVGLGELSSEEGSVGSDRGSIVDSEEEKEEEESDEDFASRSDNDQNQHTTRMSDEEEDDDGDLFADSEKEGDDIEDIEENTKSKRPTSFADELAARIKGDMSNQLKEEQIDEEDILFPPPKLTDEDFSPFGSRGGLFSGQGLFDDEDESDLFRETSRDRPAQAPVSEDTSAPSLKEFQKHEQPTPGKNSHLPTPAGLFDDNDDDDDNFFVPSCNKPPKTDKVKSTSIIFDDEEGDLFREKPAPLPVASVSQADENTTRADKTLPECQHSKSSWSFN